MPPRRSAALRAAFCVGVVGASACAPDWDRLDPSLRADDSDPSGGGAGSTGSPSVGGAGAAGGSTCEPIDDGKQCTDDACVDGEPVNPPSPKGTACSQDGGNVCDGKSKCVECNVVTDCYESDCQTGGQCKNAQNTCFMIADKPVGSPCTGGVCSASGECVECVSNAQCTAPETCGGGGRPETCGCAPSTCASLALTCGQAADGCGATVDCDNGAQDGAETDVDCGGGGACATKCGLGSKCAIGADCVSALCAGGICSL